MTEWTPLLDEGRLRPGSLHTVKLDRHQLVVVQTDDGETYALDNRCPHEGYPLATGTLRGCDLTCCWHNWKFDVRDGTCRVGGENVAAYPVRVVDGVVQADLRRPDPSTLYDTWLDSLREGLLRGDDGRTLRDVVRLLAGGYPGAKVAAEIAQFDADYAEWGTTHVLAVAADACRYFARHSAEEGAHAIAPILELSNQTHAHRPPRIRPQPIAGATEATLREAVESEDVERAEALLLGAFEAGIPRATIESWMCAALSDHFLDFGHRLIYWVKTRELLAEAGDAFAPSLLSSLLFSIVYGTREDTLPYMRAYAKRLQHHLDTTDDLPVSDELADWDAGSFRDIVLDSPQPAETIDALFEQLRRGISPSRIARELVIAASERMLRFDPAIDASEEVAENWLTITHRLTFAAAVRHVVDTWDHPDRIRFLAQAIMFIHSARPTDLPPEQRPSRTPLPGDPLEAVQQRDPVTAIRRALHPDQDMASLQHRIADYALHEPFVRPIYIAHAIKTPLAAFEEYEVLSHREDRALPVAASLWFLAGPVTERPSRARVKTAIEWVVDGKVPRKLTQ